MIPEGALATRRGSTELAKDWEEVELAELARLADDDARRAFFAGRPELLRSELTWRLADESSRLLRVDLEQAEALCGAASWLAAELSDQPARARSLRAKANVLYFQRRYEEAASTYERSVEAFSEAGSELDAAIARSSALASLGNLGRYDKAMAFAAAARATFEGLGDRLRLSRLENNVGMILSRQDRFPEALEQYLRALDLFRDVGQPVDVASALRNIAVCHQDLNDFHSSLATYSEAREYCREHGLTLIGLEVEYNIAYLYYLRGEYSQADPPFRKSAAPQSGAR